MERARVGLALLYALSLWLAITALGPRGPEQECPTYELGLRIRIRRKSWMCVIRPHGCLAPTFHCRVVQLPSLLATHPRAHQNSAVHAPSTLSPINALPGLQASTCNTPQTMIDPNKAREVTGS